MGNREKREIAKSHQATSVHDAIAVHVFAFGPEGGDGALRVDCEVKGADCLMLEWVVCPNPPAFELTTLDFVMSAHTFLQFYTCLPRL